MQVEPQRFRVRSLAEPGEMRDQGLDQGSTTICRSASRMAAASWM